MVRKIYHSFNHLIEWSDLFFITYPPVLVIIWLHKYIAHYKEAWNTTYIILHITDRPFIIIQFSKANSCRFFLYDVLLCRETLANGHKSDITILFTFTLYFPSDIKGNIIYTSWKVIIKRQQKDKYDRKQILQTQAHSESFWASKAA